MPGGGLLALVAYGSQNVLLSGNPEMTYFYKTFKKYTHFSLETTSQLMDGVTDWPYDRTVQLKSRIQRVGDIMTDMYFSFDLPAIYSKYQQTNPSTGPTTQQQFQWARYLGAAAIQSVYITVGPNKIQEFTGEYLMARALIDFPKDKFEKWQTLVGDTPELNDPANGLYGTKTATGGIYPTVYAYYTPQNELQQPQVNQPSIPATRVYVPLPFWFTEEGQGLPFVGLQYYTVDVTINLTPSQQLYTVLDASGFRMAPGFRVSSPLSNIQRNIPDYIPTTGSNAFLQNFFTDIGYTVPPLNSWPANPLIHTTYAFLPEKERNIFASKPLTYLVRQVTLVPFPEIISNAILDLEIHNPITRLVLVPRRSDSLLYKNAYANVTNWWNWPDRPKIPNNYFPDNQYIECEASSGALVPNAQLDIVQALRVLVDGNEIQELKLTPFFTDYTPYKYLSGGANRHIPVYSFELKSPGTQPCGSLNSSRIRKFQLDLQVWPLPPNSSYIYSLNVHVENYNFFLVEAGMGDLKYAL
jgi:hypothetical protein